MESAAPFYFVGALAGAEAGEGASASMRLRLEQKAPVVPPPHVVHLRLRLAHLRLRVHMWYRLRLGCCRHQQKANQQRDLCHLYTPGWRCRTLWLSVQRL